MSYIDAGIWNPKSEGPAFWASDGNTIFRARYIEHSDEEVAAGADDGHFTGLESKDDWLNISHIWVGNEKPDRLPDEGRPSSFERELSLGLLEEFKKGRKPSRLIV